MHTPRTYIHTRYTYHTHHTYFKRPHTLPGIVAPASVLLANKGMVAAAEAANLTVLTYGRENNEPENVRKQAELGVRGAILDEVSLGARACSCVLHWCY